MIDVSSSSRALLSDVGVRVDGPAVLAGRVLSLLDGRADAEPAHWLRLVVGNTPLAAPGRHVLTQSPVDIALDGDEVPVLTAESVSARLGEDIELHFGMDADPRSLRGVLDATWPLVMPRFGAFHVHGGAVLDPRGRGWLLANDAGAGKSTTVVSLALEGWGWTSDDATYLSRDGDAIVAEGWHEPVRLSARSAAALRLSREDQASVYKTPVALPPGAAAARRQRITLQRLLLPEIGGVTRLERVAAREALDTLLRASAWLVCLPRTADTYLRLLADVAELPAWRLHLGPELLDSPQTVARILLDADG